MAGEATTGAAANGQSQQLSYEQAMAADRAAFLAGDESSDADGETAAQAAAVEDDDSDLETDAADDDGDDAESVEASADDEDEDVESDDEENDDDKDLDDDEQDAKVEPDVAKRLEQVRRTDRRLREQREKLFADRERQLVEREQSIAPRLTELEKFEKLKGRGFLGMIEQLAVELGASEDDIDLAAKRFYAMSKSGKSDPKWKAAVDALQKERERDEEIKSVKKQLAEREEAEKKSAAEAEGRRNAEAFIEKAAKIASKTLAEKTPLANHLLATNPDEARGEMFVVANRLAQKLGRLPDHKQVVLEFEKHQRQVLRRFGIDPKTFKPTATKAAPAAKGTSTPAPKKGAKAPTEKKSAKDDRPLSKADFIAASRSGKYE